jgi:hypothetical protein
MTGFSMSRTNDVNYVRVRVLWHYASVAQEAQVGVYVVPRAQANAATGDKSADDPFIANLEVVLALSLLADYPDTNSLWLWHSLFWPPQSFVKIISA